MADEHGAGPVHIILIRTSSGPRTSKYPNAVMQNQSVAWWCCGYGC